jgi:hypothetical protein
MAILRTCNIPTHGLGVRRSRWRFRQRRSLPQQPGHDAQASHNGALSLGSCISAAVTVLSIRTVAPLSSLSCLALANTARLTASQAAVA